MILFYLIVIALGLVVLYFAGILALSVVVLLARAIRVATGKTTLPQLLAEDEKAMQVRGEQQAAQQKKGGFSFLSYPSPLNNWGLWN